MTYCCGCDFVGGDSKALPLRPTTDQLKIHSFFVFPAKQRLGDPSVATSVTLQQGPRH